MLEVPFTPRWAPLSHQAKFLSEASRRPFYALFWEQGTGKTKALIDNLALLAIIDGVDGGLVLAPNGVHRNWHVEELPKHWPEDAPRMTSFAWDTDRSSGKAYQAEFQAFLATPGVLILCMSYDSLMTEGGRKASWDFMRKRKRLMYISDESQRGKTPDTKRTKRWIASSVYAAYRRLASGTPMDKPFDIYSQMRFLSPLYWAERLGLSGFTAFKAHFGIWQDKPAPGGRTFKDCVAYRNLDELNACIKEDSSRVLKEDVLDLPPKTYKRAYHELTREQRRAYNELKEEALTILDSGELVTAEMALVLQLRLTQISCGFIKPAPGMPEQRFTVNPRGELFKEVLRDLTRPAIIWGRFVHDTKVAAECSRLAGRVPVIYNGARPDDALNEFHAGRADDIIANIDSNMREGYTLNEADSTLYYSNSPKLLNRLQSEDRNHRIGQLNHVTYIDFLGEGTIDSRGLDNLVAKRDVVGTVLGDDPVAWLREALQ